MNIPAGIAFDTQGNLYIADFYNCRVLRFLPPTGPSTTAVAATVVWGQTSFTIGGAATQASASSLTGPTSV